MHPKRAHVLTVFLAVALVVPLAATGATASVATTDRPAGGTAFESADGTSIAFQPDDRPDDPSTEDTIGYVDGYWYDDSLPVDDREGAHVSDEELEAVVYRSMARVETIRERTFETTPEVEVITREAFQNETEELFANTTEREELLENVRYEALLMVDRDRDAVEAFEELYAGSVAGYYEPSTDQIVLVSNDLEEVEVDEITLGHELVHALQDQLFGIEDYDRQTMNKDGAVNGLIEGDASFVDQQYSERCSAEWDCLEPQSDPPEPGDISWGQYFSLMLPYQEGPDFVEHVYDDGGWDAVDALYDDPPASTSEVIHPGAEREPASLNVADGSTGASWTVLEPEDGPAAETVGEGGIVSIFLGDSLERARSQSGGSVLEPADWYSQTATGESYEYAQPITDGWAGDELVVYTDGEESIEESGFVWRTEWTSAEDATEFRDAYLELLGLNGAEPVDGRQNALQIESGYPGSYYVEHDGETVTIVRAPATDDLPELRDGAAPEGEDTIEHAVFGTETDASDDGDDESAAGSPIPGFGAIAALVAVLAAAGLRTRSG